MKANRKVPAYLGERKNDGPPLLFGIVILTILFLAFWGGVAALIL